MEEDALAKEGQPSAPSGGDEQEPRNPEQSAIPEGGEQPGQAGGERSESMPLHRHPRFQEVIREKNEWKAQAESMREELEAHRNRFDRMQTERKDVREEPLVSKDEIKEHFAGADDAKAENYARWFGSKIEQIAERKVKSVVDGLKAEMRQVSKTTILEGIRRDYPEFREGTDFHKLVHSELGRIVSDPYLLDMRQQEPLLRLACKAVSKERAGGRLDEERNLKERSTERLRTSAGSGSGTKTNGVPSRVTKSWVLGLSPEEYRKHESIIREAINSGSYDDRS